jgi:hypothetical protein
LGLDALLAYLSDTDVKNFVFNGTIPPKNLQKNLKHHNIGPWPDCLQGKASALQNPLKSETHFSASVFWAAVVSQLFAPFSILPHFSLNFRVK